MGQEGVRLSLWIVGVSHRIVLAVRSLTGTVQIIVVAERDIARRLILIDTDITEEWVPSRTENFFVLEYCLEGFANQLAQ